MERAFNYPTHPLFGIAPLLDKSFQTVRFDPYERVLVAKIRSGQYTADLWNCNGAYLDYGDRVGSPIYQERTAFKSRYELTPEQLREAMEELERRRNDPVLKAEREAAKAVREAAKAERERIRRKWAEEQEREQEAYAAATAERARRQAERDAEWRAAAEAVAEKQRQAILQNKWQCTRCKGLTINVTVERKGFTLECQSCGQKGYGKHATLLGMLAA